MSRLRTAGALSLATLALAALATSQTSAQTPTRPGVAGVSANTKIKHVVIIMQENRSFDNYFGTYPGAAGIPGLGGHPGKVPCIPAPAKHRCVKPYHDRQDNNYGGPHDAAASVADIAGNKMNGFLSEQEQAVAKCG